MAMTHTGKFCGKSVRGPAGRVRGLPQNFVEGDFKEGCGAARRLRRMQQGEAGAAAAERKRPKARSAMRAPQPVKQERQAIAVRVLPLLQRRRDQTMPWLIMALATFRKPAMLAPATRLPLQPYSSAAAAAFL